MGFKREATADKNLLIPVTRATIGWLRRSASPRTVTHFGISPRSGGSKSRKSEPQVRILVFRSPMMTATVSLPGQAKVVQELARADLVSFNTFYLKIPCRFCEVFFNLNCGLCRTFVL